MLELLLSLAALSCLGAGLAFLLEVADSYLGFYGECHIDINRGERELTVQGGGNLLSIAVNDCKTLRAAQKEPEKYRDLKVRVGGYDDYFVDLPSYHQELQIRRCEQYARQI